MLLLISSYISSCTIQDDVRNIVIVTEKLAVCSPVSNAYWFNWLGKYISRSIFLYNFSPPKNKIKSSFCNRSVSSLEKWNFVYQIQERNQTLIQSFPNKSKVAKALKAISAGEEE